MPGHADARLEWTLRIGAALCFVGHGAFGVMTKQAWVPYFAVVGIDPTTAFAWMPVIGAVDIAMGILVLVAPRPAVAAWMVGWATWTALLRPLAGEPAWEALERAGNYGVPLALLLHAAPLSVVRRVLTATVVLLLAGHGALSIAGKPEFVRNLASVLPDHAAAALPLLGGFELALALAVALRPSVPLLVFVAAWKMATEALFVSAGAPAWEWIERGGSYAAPIALALTIAKSGRSRLLGRLALLLAFAASAAGCGNAVIFSYDTGVPRPPRIGIAVVPAHAPPAIRGESYALDVAASSGSSLLRITSLQADIAGLPPRNDATFEVQLGATATGTFRWTPQAGDRGIYVVSFIAETAGAQERRDALLWTANPGPNVAPVVTAPETVWVALDDTVSFSARATDGNDEAILGWSLDGSDWNEVLVPTFEFWVDSPGAGEFDSTATIKVVARRQTATDLQLTIRATNSLPGEAVTLVRMPPPQGAARDGGEIKKRRAAEAARRWIRCFKLVAGAGFEPATFGL